MGSDWKDTKYLFISLITENMEYIVYKENNERGNCFI